MSTSESRGVKCGFFDRTNADRERSSGENKVCPSPRKTNSPSFPPPLEISTPLPPARSISCSSRRSTRLTRTTTSPTSRPTNSSVNLMASMASSPPFPASSGAGWIGREAVRGVMGVTRPLSSRLLSFHLPSLRRVCQRGRLSR